MTAASATGDFEAVIGLEVHCELKTATKLFCGCRNEFGGEPNTFVCPVCLGLPGSLPVLNSRAVEFAICIGTALGSDVRPSRFDRKNYFYPDMPKDYQISQYAEPINVGGHLDLPDGSRVGIVRAHLEEDTGKTTHMGGGGRIHDADYSLVDYNRAGVPLVEIVSEPDIRSAEQARLYAAELRGVLVATGASDGRMEEGSMRIDANISERRAGTSELGTRCEVKNLNSLRSLGRAIDHEIERQTEIVSAGGSVVQQTRHWDEQNGVTVALRSKEEAFDYRYFSEPDLVPVEPDPSWLNEVASAIGPMPAQRRSALSDALGGQVTAAETDQIMTVVDLDLDPLVLSAVSAGVDAHLALRRTANEAAADAERARSIDQNAYNALLHMEQQGSLTATQSKMVLAEMLESGGDPKDIASAKGFEALAADSLGELVAQVVAAHPDEWARYCEGDDRVSGLFISEVMKASDKKASGKQVREELDRLRSQPR
ncbi:MAG: Asp-tRNA(Asn)/Glu-tRNA(Gln) amidotransferase subunit GatB [Acidimicrobiales bacterium]